LFERKKSFLSDFSFFFFEIGSGPYGTPPGGEGRSVESTPGPAGGRGGRPKSREMLRHSCTALLLFVVVVV